MGTIDAAAEQPKEHLRAAMQGLSRRLQASLGASGPLGDSLTKGELREEDIVAAFRPHLPARYDLVKGIIIDADGNESDPQDVIIVDTTVLPTVLGSGNTRAVPVEGVVGVIQIKSIATPRSAEHAVANLGSAKRMLPATARFGLPGDRPTFWSTSATFFGGALFLSLQGDEGTFAHAYGEAAMNAPIRERCDALCVVDQLAIVWGDPSGKAQGLHFSHRGEQAQTPLWLQAKQDSLLFFYLSLVEHLRSWITPPFNWMHYVFGPDGRSHTLSFPYTYYYDEENPPDWVGIYEDGA